MISPRTDEACCDSYFWHCPRCRGELKKNRELVCCQACDSQYQSVGDIPDLRIAGVSWIDQEADRQQAKALWEQSQNMTLEELIRTVYSAQPGRDSKFIELRTKQVLEAPVQKQKDFKGWLHPYLPKSGLLLDLGCGGGMLMAGAAAEGYASVGIDVSMTWLVVAQRMVKEWGGEPYLAAAMAESLPLPDASISSVISFDVIEHVNDPAVYLREINRVLSKQGKVLFTTPNRFSLTAEPHVFVWGVGWLPERFQQSFVKWRSGKDYLFTKLLGSMELNKLLVQNTEFLFKIHPGVVPDSEIARFKPIRKRLALFYNRIQKLPIIRMMFQIIGPFFYVDATKI
jgi:2-polyprenyl-3-methyl-5-hydroxy-6-metoxy-1,4-benzoquinol methylase